MGFWKKLFKRKKIEIEEQENWEQIVYARDQVNFHDPSQRSQYITNCLEQIAEASREMDLLTGEYNLVTSYLTDIEEIESLPDEEKDGLEEFAQKLQNLEQERQAFQDKKQRMSDEIYYQMRKQESEIEEGIRKLKEAENYSALVKQDLKRLDRERHAYEYRRQELEAITANLRGMAVIFFTALLICIGMLAVLQFGFGMNTLVGYFIAVIAGAFAITIVAVKYIDADRELGIVENSSNKLVQLQNKVKIRYVNNRNLLDYLYIKYNTDNAGRLEKRWRNYLQEKEERKQYAEAESKIEYYSRQLINQMSRYRVKAPERWVNQTSALLDKREMVEIRHDLIVQRQSLRKQLDYNNDLAKTARREITDVVIRFPKYAAQITEMVDEYERKFH